MASENTYSDTFVIGETLPAADLNRIQTETETAFETCLNELTNDGVIGSTAFTPTIDGTSVALAAGAAYCQGKSYNGSTSVSFVAQP